ncbi:glycoside hydrolase family 19 protein [Undibacterium arcticum]|uniref:Glycoside hydrolase family 19 protein n=1 Tax=Undibacterium arcticum TaxID=1762892 RepID=A0ABV7F8H8_9BURK
MLTAQQIAAATGAPVALATNWLSALTDAMHDFDIGTPARQAAFLAQIGHESTGLSAVVENLNYGAQGLANTWPGKFAVDPAAKVKIPNALANMLAHSPEAIANHAYAGKGGNGPVSSGDGWRYRGRGPIQLTTLANYANARDQLRKLLDSVPDFVVTPDAVADPRWGALCAGLYWSRNGCNALADKGQFDAITRAINGPAMAGAAERRALWAKAKSALGVK